MQEILKYLKKSIGWIFVIILALFVQAWSELSLPSYTSDIINVGISQKGIEETIPKQVRQNVLDNLLLFVETQEDRKFVLQNYSLENGIYKLTATDEEDIERLEKILVNPIVVNTALSYSSVDSQDSSNMMAQLMQEAGIPAQTDGVSVIEYVQSMDDTVRSFLVQKINTSLDSITDSVKDGICVNYIYIEYKSIGLEVDSMQMNYIKNTGLKMIALTVLGALVMILIEFLSSRIAAKLAKDIRKDLFAKVLSFSDEEIKKFGIASLITRSTNDIQQIQMLIMMFFRMILYSPILATGAILKVMHNGANMTWIVVLGTISVLLFVISLFAIAFPKFEKVQGLVDKLNLVTREIITGIPVIRAFSNQDYEKKKFKKVNTTLTDVNLFIGRVMNIMRPGMMFHMNAIILLIIWVGAQKIDAGSIQLGEMMAFMEYSMQIIVSFLMISMLAIVLPRAMVSIRRVQQVLKQNLAVKDPVKPQKFPEDVKGTVEFRNVNFRYPNSDEDVLKNITFIANTGETVAFIGSTGSGKSTVINLIPRFFDATSGEVLVDGLNVKDVSQYDLHKKIGYVPQMGVLFSGTIESNIKYGDYKIEDKQMKEAAKIAQASEFIEQKEDKYKSAITQSGTNVSGGQKQRLSIARAISKNPEIYIFDDSFSALDFKTDKALRAALNDYTKDSTVFIVTQRISTIMHADKIIVLDDGKIVGIGKHEELLDSCKVYKEIAMSQLSEDELNKNNK